MSLEALMIFTKNPEAGKVKTRLAASVGNEAALAIYQQLLLHTVAVTHGLLIHKFVFYSEEIIHEDIWNNGQFFKQLQVGNDLGQRMQHAFELVFNKGYAKVIIIGTDCPSLNSNIIMNAFAALDESDIVIGPALDGGYYLLGINRLYPEIFEGIHWSASTVLTETLAKCNILQLRYRLMPALNDIDEEKDLIYLKEKYK